MDENELLNQSLGSSDHPVRRQVGGLAAESAPRSPSDPNQLESRDFTSWVYGANGTFRPTGKSTEKLPPAVYKIQQDAHGHLWLKTHAVELDEIVDLPESSSARALESIRKFWKRGDRYKQYGLLHKRGMLLWGPPGSGKTVTVNILMRDIVRAGGIVLLMENPDWTTSVLADLRLIETERPVIVVLEDIDEIIERFGEHSVLALLDGENQIQNVCHLATTNYPDRLGARIVNRPSRFDERIYVGMPGEAARRAYISRVGNTIDVDLWVKDTEGLSIAHLRELSAAVLCLDVPYEEALKRLRGMMDRPREVDGFESRKMGLIAAQKRS